jgi:hypothetical protein
VGQRALTYFVAMSCIACCTRFSFSLLRAVHHARFAVTFTSSQAVRARRARHHSQGIAGHQKQRYRAAILRRGGPPS